MTSIFVSDLSWDTTDEDLIAHFDASGVILKAEILRRKRRGSTNKTSTGMGTVEFQTREDATKAVKLLHGSILRDRKIRCKIDRQAEIVVPIPPTQLPSQTSSIPTMGSLNQMIPRSRFVDSSPNLYLQTTAPITSIQPRSETIVSNTVKAAVQASTPNLLSTEKLTDSSDDATITRTEHLIDPCKIFVTGLSWSMKSAELSSLFATVGTVVNVEILSSKRNGKSLGCAVVEFADSNSPVLAILRFSKSKIDGRKIIVRHNYIDQSERAPSDVNRVAKLNTNRDPISTQKTRPKVLGGASEFISPKPCGENRDDGLRSSASDDIDDNLVDIDDFSVSGFSVCENKSSPLSIDDCDSNLEPEYCLDQKLALSEIVFVKDCRKSSLLDIEIRRLEMENESGDVGDFADMPLVSTDHLEDESSPGSHGTTNGCQVDAIADAEAEPETSRDSFDENVTLESLEFSIATFDPNDSSKRPSGWDKAKASRVKQKEAEDRRAGKEEWEILKMRAAREAEVEQEMTNEAKVIHRIRLFSHFKTAPSQPKTFHSALSKHKSASGGNYTPTSSPSDSKSGISNDRSSGGGADGGDNSSSSATTTSSSTSSSPDDSKEL